MPKEYLLPITIELPDFKGLRKTRATAAINAQQIQNLQERLASGVIRRFGEDRPLSPRQIERRETHLKVLEERVDVDVRYLQRVLSKTRIG